MKQIINKMFGGRKLSREENKKIIGPEAVIPKCFNNTESTHTITTSYPCTTSTSFPGPALPTYSTGAWTTTGHISAAHNFSEVDFLSQLPYGASPGDIVAVLETNSLYYYNRRAGWEYLGSGEPSGDIEPATVEDCTKALNELKQNMKDEYKYL